MGVLSSLKILDFSTLLPGPYGSMLLADMGADVVRVEAPNRPDMVRAVPPVDEYGVSAGHAYLNRNKRSIALDLKVDGAAEIVKRLVQTYDIVLEQFRPGVMDRLGIGYEALSAVNPQLIYCALTGYGQTGPLRDRAGHDNNYLALAGVMSVSGRNDHGPVPQGVQIADIGAGSLGAVTGILAAVVHRHTTGAGQFVDVSMFDGAVAWNCQANPPYLAADIVNRYETMGLNGGTHYDFYRTKDGRYMSVGSLEPKFWMGLCQTLGRPDLVDRLTLPGPEMDAVKAEIQQEFQKKTQAEWTEIFNAVDVCVEPVLSVDEALAHPHVNARELVVDVPRPEGGSQKQIGSPIKFSANPPRYDHIGPALGAHTEEVLAEAGYSEADVAAFRAKGSFGAAATV